MVIVISVISGRTACQGKGTKHEEPSRKSEWVVETSIEVDCQHVPDHESMENVFNQQERRQTPECAVDELLDATRQLAALAMDNPIDYWTSKTKS